MNPSWNLLSYPTLHQQRRRRHRMLTSLAGLAVGAGLAAATLHALQAELPALRAQQAQLQAQWLEAQQQTKLRQQQKVASDTRRQQALHLQHITLQHQAWAALYDALTRQAPGDAWRLSRLQLESGQLELSGWSRDFDHLNAHRDRLSRHLQAHWPAPVASAPGPSVAFRQNSVVTRLGPSPGGAGSDTGLEFVWVSPWPAWPPAGLPGRQAGAGSRP